MGDDVRGKPPRGHIGGSFRWEEKPACCDLLVAAVEDYKFVFVSDVVVGEHNSFYMLPLADDGTLIDEGGFPIHFCPWCGSRLMGKKKKF